LAGIHLGRPLLFGSESCVAWRYSHKREYRSPRRRSSTASRRPVFQRSRRLCPELDAFDLSTDRRVAPRYYGCWFWSGGEPEFPGLLSAKSDCIVGPRLGRPIASLQNSAFGAPGKQLTIISRTHGCFEPANEVGGASTANDGYGVQESPDRAERAVHLVVWLCRPQGLQPKSGCRGRGSGTRSSTCRSRWGRGSQSPARDRPGAKCETSLTATVVP